MATTLGQPKAAPQGTGNSDRPLAAYAARCRNPETFDEANRQNEDRWFTLGYDAGGRLLAVAHTYEATGPTNVRVRIISARTATRRERRSYEEEP